jgi:hypothetical protein
LFNIFFSTAIEKHFKEFPFFVFAFKFHFCFRQLPQNSAQKAIEEEEETLRKLHQLLNDKTSTLEEIRTSLSKVSNKERGEWKNGSPLIWAVLNNRKDAIEHMVKQERFNVDSVSKKCQDYFDWCALGAAIGSGNHELAKFLVHDLKANANITRLDWGSLLTASIFKMDLKAVNLLLTDLKADPNQSVVVDGCGNCSYTPIHYAMWNDFQK